MKFKVGDKVRVIGRSPDIAEYFHEVGVVYQIDTKDRLLLRYPYCVRFSETKYENEFTGRELEKID